MLDQSDSTTTADGRTIGGTVMEMKNITLRFGGVVAIKDISFDVREGEIRAIIGPNGAGKSSMLNVISGFYNPQEGEVWFRGAKRPPMRPYQIARQGIARTFQNIALFDGMSRAGQHHDRSPQPYEREFPRSDDLVGQGRARRGREPREG